MADLKGQTLRRRSGQSMVEYLILVGIVALGLFYMAPAIKRVSQSLVKVTADQLGNQQSSEQDIAPRIAVNTSSNIEKEQRREGSGYLALSTSNAQMWSNPTVREQAAGLDERPVPTITTTIDEKTKVTTSSMTDLGFTHE